MDVGMMRQFDPTSSMFQTSATRNLTNVGMASVRTQKEVAPQEEDDASSILDNVNISMPETEELEADDAVNNAAMSGELADVADDLEDDEEEIRERHNNTREEELERFLQNNDNSANLNINGVSNLSDVKRLNAMDDPSIAVRDILKDVPQSSLEPASNIVSNQVQNGRPAEALVQLKPVEGCNVIDFQAAPQVGVLDIHDTGNKPMTLEPADEMSPADKQSMAKEQMDKLISNLPDDRKAMVGELREAVNAWASNAGIDGSSEFAKQLHNLAQGWDDETLMAAAGAYSEASMAMSDSQGA
ncbi:hypothetical protein IJT17_00980 [bacterium]|nr:hypothetical protein [bacterium]